MSKAVDPFGTVRDRAVYLPEADALVAADLHLGMAATSAVDAPIDEGPHIVEQVCDLLDRFEPATLVLAGDILHTFGSVQRVAHDTLTTLEEVVADAEAELVVLAGNHDTLLANIVAEPPGDWIELPDGTVICHGHERPPTNGRRYVVGHDHPVIEIEGRRRPCFLYGRTSDDGADVLVLPAFSPAVRGTAVNGWADGDPLSPFLTEVSGFHPVVWDEEAGLTLAFPALKSLQPYL